MCVCTGFYVQKMQPYWELIDNNTHTHACVNTHNGKQQTVVDVFLFWTDKSGVCRAVTENIIIIIIKIIIIIANNILSASKQVRSVKQQKKSGKITIIITIITFYTT